LSASDLSGFLEGDQRFAEPVVVDPEFAAQLGPGKRTTVAKEIGEFPLQGDLPWIDGRPVLEFEMAGGAILQASEAEDHRLGSPCRSVLQGEENVLSLAREVGVGVTERVKVGAAPERLTRMGMSLLARVVDL